MARGGYRVGSGPKKGTKYGPRGVKKLGVVGKVKGIPADVVIEAAAENLDPLTYMLRVMNDPQESDKARKDRMAIAAAPFMHARKGEGAGKKVDKEDRAKAASAGKYRASAPPVLKVVTK
jgi:hypothetical protein